MRYRSEAMANTSYRFKIMLSEPEDGFTPLVPAFPHCVNSVHALNSRDRQGCSFGYVASLRKHNEPIAHE